MADEKKKGPGELPPIRRSKMEPPTEGVIPQRTTIIAQKGTSEPTDSINLRVPKSYKEDYIDICHKYRLEQIHIFFFGMIALENMGIEKAREEFQRRGGTFGKQGRERSIPPKLKL